MSKTEPIPTYIKMEQKPRIGHSALAPGSRLGKRLREWRIDANLTQELLEEILGAHHGTFSSWETGRHLPSEKYHLKICAALNVELPLLQREWRLSMEEKRVIENRLEQGESYQHIAESLSYNPDPGNRLVFVKLAVPADVLRWIKKSAKAANMSVSAYLSKPIARAYYAKKRGNPVPISYDDSAPI